MEKGAPESIIHTETSDLEKSDSADFSPKNEKQQRSENDILYVQKSIQLPPPANHGIYFRRRVDLRVLPLLACLYAVSLVDRTNLSTARLVGLQKDLVRCLHTSKLV
jgi:hypothetical protein